MLRLILLLVLGSAVFLSDFFSKSAVFNHLEQPLVVFNDLLGVDFFINLTFNRGAAWGLFSNFQTTLLIVRMLVIAGILLYIILRRNPKIDFPLTLIAFGAIGNVVDYFHYSYVIDFLEFSFWGYHFPLFNIADAAITMGVAWLLLSSFFTKKPKHEYS